MRSTLNLCPARMLLFPRSSPMVAVAVSSSSSVYVSSLTPAVFWIDVFVSPTSWPDAAQAVDQAMNGNTSAMLDAANEKEVIDLERSAVTCNDVPSFSPPTAEEYVDQFLFQLENKTRFVLAIDTHEPDSGCEYWPATPPERYTGPFNKTLSNPILIISNTVSPLVLSAALLLIVSSYCTARPCHVPSEWKDCQ